MKAHVADYATRVCCVRIEPANDAPVVRLSGYPHELAMSNGAVYQTELGYEFSGYSSTSDFAASSFDLEGILQQGAISRADLFSGIYDNARVKFFATSWAAPVEDEEPCGQLFFGKVDTTDERYSVQLMSMEDVLSQSVGRTHTPTCGWTLFDQTLDGRIIATDRSRCTGPRAAPDGPSFASYLVTGTITSVTSQSIVTDTARTEAADWFGYGNIRFITGPNAGLAPMQIKSFASGVIELIESFFYLPAVGDQYEMIPGCRKRMAEDCVGKFGNGRNFGGKPHVPSPSQYQQVGRGA